MVGYVEYKEKKHYFDFDIETYELDLTDSDIGIDNLKMIFNNSNKDDTPNDLHGITMDKSKKIIFLLNFKNSSNTNFRVTKHKFKVYAYYEFEIDEDIKVDALSFYGRELDCFYEVGRAYNSNIDITEGSVNLEVIEFSKLEQKTEFFINEDKVEATLNISHQLNHSSATPLTFETEMKFKFNTINNLERIFDIYYCAKKFLMYIAYRENVEINKVELKVKTDNDKYKKIGKLFIYSQNLGVIEKEKNVSQKIVKYDLIKDIWGAIIESLSNHKIYIEHIPFNSIEKNRIDPARFIIITAGFEREFMMFYGENLKTRENEIFKKIKSELISKISEVKTEKSSKEKKYVSSAERFIEKWDFSLEDKIRRSIKDFKYIVDLYVKYVNDDEYREVDIPKRVSEQRNNYAHGNIDVEMNGLVVLDLRLIEIINYAFVLRKLGQDDKSICKTVFQLFSIKMMIDN
ncbi:MAG TPA: hypothetical protein DCP90_02860 [Clostridiales bacterium]|nr:MAG: hypothetical protein A2Y22_00105 [Clostridiales bacterium GWD2_32_59]HAN09534.1 hypothetical protein [Clostridiales bacterium]